jgi:hypothetical protein
MKKSNERLITEDCLKAVGIIIGDRTWVFNDKRKTFRRIKFSGINGVGYENLIINWFKKNQPNLTIKVGHTNNDGNSYFDGLFIKIMN